MRNRPRPVCDAPETRALHDGLALRAGIDAPWLADIGRDRLAAACRPLRDLAPRLMQECPTFSGETASMMETDQGARSPAEKSTACPTAVILAPIFVLATAPRGSQRGTPP